MLRTLDLITLLNDLAAPCNFNYAKTIVTMLFYMYFATDIARSTMPKPGRKIKSTQPVSPSNLINVSNLMTYITAMGLDEELSTMHKKSDAMSHSCINFVLKVYSSEGVCYGLPQKYWEIACKLADNVRNMLINCQHFGAATHNASLASIRTHHAGLQNKMTAMMIQNQRQPQTSVRGDIFFQHPRVFEATWLSSYLANFHSRLKTSIEELEMEVVREIKKQTSVILLNNPEMRDLFLPPTTPTSSDLMNPLPIKPENYKLLLDDAGITGVPVFQVTNAAYFHRYLYSKDVLDNAQQLNLADLTDSLFMATSCAEYDAACLDLYRPLNTKDPAYFKHQIANPNQMLSRLFLDVDVDDESFSATFNESLENRDKIYQESKQIIFAIADHFELPRNSDRDTVVMQFTLYAKKPAKKTGLRFVINFYHVYFTLRSAALFAELFNHMRLGNSGVWATVSHSISVCDTSVYNPGHPCRMYGSSKFINKVASDPLVPWVSTANMTSAELKASVDERGMFVHGGCYKKDTRNTAVAFVGITKQGQGRINSVINAQKAVTAATLAKSMSSCTISADFPPPPKQQLVDIFRGAKIPIGYMHRLCEQPDLTAALVYRNRIIYYWNSADKIRWCPFKAHSRIGEHASSLSLVVSESGSYSRDDSEDSNSDSSRNYSLSASPKSPRVLKCDLRVFCRGNDCQNKSSKTVYSTSWIPKT